MLGRTALFIACLNLVPIDIVRLLLYNPQNFVNLCDKSGVSPLMLACLHNNLSVVQALIQCGADLKLKDKDNHWALWYAYYISNFIINNIMVVCYPYKQFY